MNAISKDQQEIRRRGMLKRQYLIDGYYFKLVLEMLFPKNRLHCVLVRKKYVDKSWSIYPYVAGHSCTHRKKGRSGLMSHF